MQRVYFFLDHCVVEKYLKYCCLLAYDFCKIHFYILLGSKKKSESGRKVNKVLCMPYAYHKRCVRTKGLTDRVSSRLGDMVALWRPRPSDT